MPYFLNCNRCNKDNRYSNLGSQCDLCSGTSRDWREDHELTRFHKWAGFSIDGLKEKSTIDFVDDHGRLQVFTYIDSIPTCSVRAVIEEIRKSIEGSQQATPYPSQIFCKHKWALGENEALEICTKCRKERDVVVSVKQDKIVLQYDKDLHDQRYYFPNRCHACEHYSDSCGQPKSGADIILCNIGGKVPADTGCAEFKADLTADCRSCWNLSLENEGEEVSYSCNLKGSIPDLFFSKCHEHVRKESTGEPLPATPDAILRNKEFLVKKEYPHNPKIGKLILESMLEVGIRMVTPDEFSLDQRCSTCVHEGKIEANYGSCGYHELGILGYSGDNPFGYDEMICEYYSRKEGIAPVEYPMVHIDEMREGTRKLNDRYHVKLRRSYCDVIETDGERVITTFSDRTPRFMQYNKKRDCIDLYFYGEPDCEELSVDPNVSYTHPVMIKTWVDIDNDKLFEAIDRVVLEQRNHGVYSGSKTDNCERCCFVEKNWTYPDGSPTGLICSQKKVFVTASGRCDNYEVTP